MSSLADAFAMLGLPNGSTFDQVKKAYHLLALKTHPDRHPGIDTALFLKIQAAYELFAKRENPGFADLPHPDDVVPPPTAPPRPASWEAPPQTAPSTPLRQVPSPEPQRREAQPRPCRHGLHCTHYGCKFAHPVGYVVPDSPPVCRHGWDCRHRDTTCKFTHIREITERKGRLLVSTTSRVFVGLGGARINSTTTTTRPL